MLYFCRVYLSLVAEGDVLINLFVSFTCRVSLTHRANETDKIKACRVAKAPKKQPPSPLLKELSIWDAPLAKSRYYTLYSAEIFYIIDGR